MPYTIAVAGKGGTGKTTLCGILIDWLIKTGRKPVLAVDADANSNLNEVLGVEAPVSLGDIREEIAHAEATGAVPSGMSKQDYMEFRFNAALDEEDDFDMLVMGRTQGKGCYCFVNGLLQTQLQKFSGSYQYVVVDNEAGWGISAGACCPRWMCCCWCPTAAAGASRPWGGSPSWRRSWASSRSI